MNLTDEDRCPEMPPGMHPCLRQTVGAQYHRCRKGEGHEPPCVNGGGVTWGFVLAANDGPQDPRPPER